jgi:hypothetical protein
MTYELGLAQTSMVARQLAGGRCSESRGRQERPTLVALRRLKATCRGDKNHRGREKS